MSTHGWMTVALLAAPLMLAGAARGDAPSDAEFARQAASAMQLEVELGRYAEQQAQSQAVKQFGRQMVDAHSKAMSQLEDVAKQEDLSLPADPIPKHEQEIERLKGKDGAAFDQAYMDAMVKDHEHDLETFRQQAKSGDTAVDQWAATQVPVLERHLAMARNVQGEIESGGNEGAGSEAHPFQGEPPLEPEPGPMH